MMAIEEEATVGSAARATAASRALLAQRAARSVTSACCRCRPVELDLVADLNLGQERKREGDGGFSTDPYGTVWRFAD